MQIKFPTLMKFKNYILIHHKQVQNIDRAPGEQLHTGVHVLPAVNNPC